MKVVLATESPFKRAALEKTGLQFTTLPSDYEEDMTLALGAEELARTLALGKARNIAGKQPGAVVIGTDVFVSYDGKKIGKPQDAAEAKRVLQRYRGQTVDVVCGLAVVKDSEEQTHVEVAKLTFRNDTSDEELDAYIATGEPLRSGGCFTHDRLGTPLITREEGDHSAIIGIPLYTTFKFLRQFGVNPLCQR